jgi:SulP family sulfate permease
MAPRALAQISSGLILGLSSVIYAASYAALMFSGPLAGYVGYGIAICLITAAIGGLYGRFAEEPTLVSGPDGNTSSVLAGILGTALAAGHVPASGALNQALVILLAASLCTAACFLLIERFKLTRLVRFVPLQVTAGFLASSGWLMASGALNVMAGTPLTFEGVQALAQRPWRPELLGGIALTGVLALLHRRLSAAFAIPLFVLGATALVNFGASAWCHAPACDASAWFFASFDHLHWRAPWSLRLDGAVALSLVPLIPSFLALAFIGTLTVLLSLSSLELTYGRDFRLEQALRLHGRSTIVATLLGGYLGVISIGRSTMCRSTGGGRWSGFIIAGICLAVLLGLGSAIAWVPKAALGALVLYIGLGMLKQWLWDLRAALRPSEWLQVLGILLCVVAFGYVIGFFAGVLAACIFFVVNYSRMPFIGLDTTIATARSTVIRNAADLAWLAREGMRCRVGRFDGFVFFGVASAIYDWYQAGDPQRQPLALLDFSRARGIDPSAVAVLGKIIRDQAMPDQRLLLVVPRAMQQRLELAASPRVELFGEFDVALERAEDLLLATMPAEAAQALQDGWLGPGASDAQRSAFRAYLQPLRIAAAQQLFAEGQASDEMYFVERGSLEVVKAAGGGRSVRLCKVRAGAVLGEMAMYTGQPRSASALASEPCELLVLTRQARERIQLEQPALLTLLDRQVVLGLAGSLMRTNSLLQLQTA